MSLPLILSIILSVILILILGYYFIPFPKVTYNFQEAIQSPDKQSIEYVISSKYVSEGAFVSGHKVTSTIEVKAVQGEDFEDISTIEIFIGKIGDEIYKYPLTKKNNYLLGGAMLTKNDIEISDDYKTLKGSIDVKYSLPREYKSYTIHLKTRSGKEYGWVSSKNVIINTPDVLAQMKSHRLNIIMLIIALLGLILPILLKK